MLVQKVLLACSKGVIKKNTASRKKSRLDKKLAVEKTATKKTAAKAKTAKKEPAKKADEE